jgi:PAS domain S-box-containing protein
MDDKTLNNLKSQFFDQAEINFILWDKDLNCLDANESFLKMHNLQRSEIAGKNMTCISPDVVTSGRLELYKEVLRTGRTLVLDEIKSVTESGTRYFHIKAFKVGDGLGLVIKDITNVKETIEKYKNSQEKLNKIINSTNEMVHHLSLTGEIIWVNEPWKKHMGVTDEEVIGKELSGFIDELTRVELKRVMPVIIRGDRVDNLSCRFISKAGELIFLEGQTIPVFENGLVVGSYAFLRNVTPLKKLEQERTNLNITLEQKVIGRTAELQKAKATLSESQTIAEMGSWTWDYASNKTTWSENLYTLFGLKINEIEPSFEYFMSRMHPADHHLIQNANSELMKEKKPVEIEMRIMFPDNKIKWLLNRIIPVIENEQITSLRGINIDVTKRKIAEEEMRKSHKFVDSILENIPTMIFVKDATNLRFLRLNKAGETLLGLSGNDLIGKNDYDFFPKEQADSFTQKDHEVLSKREVLDIPEEIIETKHGKRLLHTKKITITDEENNPLYLVGISEDITERRKTEEQIKKLNAELEQKVEDRTREIIRREQQYHLLIDTMREGVLYVNVEDEIVFANKRFCEMTGYEEKEIIGKKAHEIFLDEDKREQIKIINNSRKEDVKSNYEMQIKTKSGEIISVSINGAPVKNEQGAVIGSVGTHADISELKQHVEDLEEIIFSLSHKVRQPVVHILGIAGLLDNKEIPMEELKKVVGYMKDSAGLLDNFTKELTNLTTEMKNRKRA